MSYGKPEPMTAGTKFCWVVYFVGVTLIFLGILATPEPFHQKLIVMGVVLIGSMVLAGIGRWFRDEF